LAYCSSTVGLLKAYFKGRLRGIDVSDVARRVVDRLEGGLYKCLLCGGIYSNNHIWRHLYEKHCREVEDILGRVRYRRAFEPGRDRKRSHVNIIFKCSGCGWSYSFEAELTGAGVPNVRRLYRELLGIVIPFNCPKCGRRFKAEIDRLEFQPGGGVVWDSMC
jgi:hypothetical protein